MNESLRNIGIRTASINDISSLSKLGEKSFLDTYASHELYGDSNAPLNEYASRTFSEGAVSAEFKKENVIFYIFELNNKPIGYAKLIDDNPEEEVVEKNSIHLECIYLLKECCEKGFGSIFLEHCINEAKKMGKKSIWLGCWDLNEKANRFYEKKGFVRRGIMKFEISPSHFDNDVIYEKKI